MNYDIDATGVRLLPGDTSGYLIDGLPASYRLARRHLHVSAMFGPEWQSEYAALAQRLNETHLRRMLMRARKDQETCARWVIENSPRGYRKAFC